MLGGRSLFQEMDEDPFFAGHRQHMRMMESMFSDPFRMMGQPMLEPPRQAHQRSQHRDTSRAVQPAHHGQLSPFDMFGNFDSMFSNMRSMMGNMQRSFESVQNNPNAHCFQQSSYMSYSNTGTGQPKVYQATSSTRTAPGGVRETKKTMRDSESGLEKMAIGHHIRDRGHVMQKSRNRRTGDQDENEELINLDDSDKQHFENEWKEKTRHQNSSTAAGRGLDYARRGERSHDIRGGRTGERAAIEAPRERRTHFRERE